MPYFSGVSTKAEAKKRFHKLALELHPDVGGSEEAMKQLQQEYSDFLENGPPQSDHLHDPMNYYRQTRRTQPFYDNDEWNQAWEKMREHVQRDQRHSQSSEFERECNKWRGAPGVDNMTLDSLIVVSKGFWLSLSNLENLFHRENAYCVYSFRRMQEFARTFHNTSILTSSIPYGLYNLFASEQKIHEIRLSAWSLTLNINNYFQKYERQR